MSRRHIAAQNLTTGIGVVVYPPAGNPAKGGG